MDAARHWASYKAQKRAPGGENADIAEELRGFGASPEMIQQWEERAEEDGDDDFEVLPENWDTVMLFLRLNTQWRFGAMGGVFGLDYAGVEAAMRLMGLWRNRVELFDGLQVMEAAALPSLNERAKP